LPPQKQDSTTRNSFFVQQPRIKFKEQAIKCYISSTIFVVLKFAELEKWAGITLTQEDKARLTGQGTS